MPQREKSEMRYRFRRSGVPLTASTISRGKGRLPSGPSFHFRVKAMVEDREIWRAAVAMIRRYGGFARLEAATRTISMYADGDRPAVLAWQRVVAAIDKLQAEEPAPGEWVQ